MVCVCCFACPRAAYCFFRIWLLFGFDRFLKVTLHNSNQHDFLVFLWCILKQPDLFVG